MSSPQSAEPLSAQDRFRQAFERLKAGKPKVLAAGVEVSQNNVAREAGCDTSALKKARFPALVAEIKAYVELHNSEEKRTGRNTSSQTLRRSTETRLSDALLQRDKAQSQLSSANLRIVELTAEVQALQRRLDELQPAPIRLGVR